MKQIKTVIREISSATQFDMAVNRLLANGWELKTRKIIDVPGDISESFSFPVIHALYAELEKEMGNNFEEVTL